MQHLLNRAKSLVRQGRIAQAIKIYKGLRVTFPNNPQLNTELGILLLHHRPANEAIEPLEQAVKSSAYSLELWLSLLVAHQRSGDLKKARDILSEIRQRGFPEGELILIAKELYEPPKERLDAIDKLLDQKNNVDAEIAARLLLQDFPEFSNGVLILEKVLNAAFTS